MFKLSDAEVYEKHAPDLVRFATGLVGSDDAPDVVADAFLNAVGSSAWADVRDPRPYLYRCVLNEVRMRHRSKVRRRARERRAAPVETVHDTLPRVEVLEAIGGLSPRQRAVVFLTYWEDLTTEMAADRLGISAGSVKRHLARARSKLKEALDE